MAKITVFGGTGYAGGNVVREAANRGHSVTSYSRVAPDANVDGVTYVFDSILDDAVLAAAFESADVVISALSPRGELEGRMVELAEKFVALSRENNVRLGVLGGAGSLLIAPGGPKLSDTDGFPGEFKGEAIEMGEVLDLLRAAPEDLDWFFVSPAAGFGSWAVGEATGVFRLGTDVLLVDENGESNISGADYATAVVNEIESPAHIRQRFTVAY